MVIDAALAPRRLLGRDTSTARPSRDWAMAAVIVVLTASITALVVRFPHSVSYAAFVFVAVAAATLLHGTQLLASYVTLAAAGVTSSVVPQAPKHTVGSFLVVLAVTMGVLLVADRRRSEVGIPAAVGTSMLVDLRERLRAQGRLPVLPNGWNLDSCIAPAHGDSFSGDFVVADCPTTSTLEIAVVDVSGKGCTAGSRSLLLGGALSGLLGAVEPDRFLPCANQHLVRQGWSEGFATAIHAAIDLETGRFSVGSAGHPAAVHFQAGRGRWQPVSGASGVLLGVLDQQSPADYPRAHGVMERGDALLLFTDGVIEAPGFDLFQGLDRLLGQADRAAATGFSGAAGRLCAAARSGETDDRAIVLLWRT